MSSILSFSSVAQSFPRSSSLSVTMPPRHTSGHLHTRAHLDKRADLEFDICGASRRSLCCANLRTRVATATEMPAEAPVGAFSWLGFAFLTVNSAMAINRSKGDPAALAFVAFSYLDLLLLFYCHRRFESAAPGSPARRRLKVAVWLLTTMLTAVLSYKVAAIMPLSVQILVWAMAAAAAGGGFYALFLFQEEGKDG